MDISQTVGLICATILFGGAMFYVFTTKIEGFGPLTTALPILLAALYSGTVAIIFGRLDSCDVANMIFAALGYGGGLLTAKWNERRSR